MILTLQQRLNEAQAAYHALLTGASVREVHDSSGERIIYTQANRESLKAYIATLEAQIRSASGSSVGPGPMTAVF